ncbi:cilia- and flagella-associated protein 161-like [Argopecten irradians]|uniref:cilia- and flagella-associated protein 161-like n=1 Tax=Argopecten irradians TaxID=31199 RepID=UPI003714786A
MNNVRTYNSSVRVGNWNEDIQLEEDALKEFLEKRDRGELPSQKRSKLKDMLFKPVSLSISRDGCVHYGDVVALQCLGAQDRTNYTNDGPRATCMLTTTPQASNLLQMTKMEGICDVSGSTTLEPNLRSSFVITGCEPYQAKGNKLCYGEDFYLCTMDGEGGNLYLQSDRATLQKSASQSRHQAVTFVPKPSALTKWRMLYYDPRMRMENEGLPVPANSIVIMCHRVTNQDLAVEENFQMRTPFGHREYEISAHTFLDSHRAEKDVNRWMVLMGVPGDEIRPVGPDC